MLVTGTLNSLKPSASTESNSLRSLFPCLKGLRTRLSGVFNTLTPVVSAKQAFFGVGAWNANGLFCVSDYSKMCSKIKLLAKHAPIQHILRSKDSWE